MSKFKQFISIEYEQNIFMILSHAGRCSIVEPEIEISPPQSELAALLLQAPSPNA